MNDSKLSTNQQYSNKNPITNTTSWMTNLYNTVSVPVAVARDALAERLQNVRETASLLYGRIMDNRD